MAARNRDAIFELVVLKDEKNRKKKQQDDALQDFQDTERSRPGPVQPTNERNHHEDTRNSITEALQDTERSRPGPVWPTNVRNHHEDTRNSVTKADDRFMFANASFDNAGYDFSKSDQEICKKHNKPSSVSDTKYLVLLISLMIFLILLAAAGIIIGVSLASVNTSKVAQLQQTAVDNASYQMASERSMGMFQYLQGNMQQLNESIAMLAQQLLIISSQLNNNDSVLTERIESLQNDTNSLIEATMQLNSTLQSQSNRIENLDRSQNSSNARLEGIDTKFTSSLVQVNNSVGAIERRLTTPVDLFEHCETVVNSTTLLLSSEDPELMFRAETSPINTDSNNDTYITDLRCQLQADISADFIRSTHLRLAQDGSVSCYCTVLLPLSVNGTHEYFEEMFEASILCQLVTTRCLRWQSLYTIT